MANWILSWGSSRGQESEAALIIDTSGCQALGVGPGCASSKAVARNDSLGSLGSVLSNLSCIGLRFFTVDFFALLLESPEDFERQTAFAAFVLRS